MKEHEQFEVLENIYLYFSEGWADSFNFVVVKTRSAAKSMSPLEGKITSTSLTNQIKKNY